MRVAIIPARGGSKRIPRKNIKAFAGQPVIGHTISVLQNSGLFSEVLVSTDDKEIATVAQSFGAEVLSLRPKVLSDDVASTDAVVYHALKEAMLLFGEFEQGCCVYPVNPFLDEKTLKDGLELMIKSNADSCFSVVQYEFPIEQALTLLDGKPKFCWLEEIDKPSQELESHYHDAGMFYWFNINSFLRNASLFSSNSICLRIESLACQDINTHDDWALAEMKLARLNDLQKK